MNEFAIAADDLWDYAATRYAQPGVKQLCLQWQDEFGGHVNAVFALLWVQEQGWHLVDFRLSLWGHLLAQTHQVIVAPVRAKRMAWEDKSSPYYRVLLSDELDAERQQQRHLVQFLFQQRSQQAIDLPPTTYYEQYVRWHIAEHVCATQAEQARNVAQQLHDAIVIQQPQ